MLTCYSVIQRLQSGTQLHDFHSISQLDVDASISVTLGIDFNDTLQPAEFDLLTSDRTFKVKIEAPVGELMSATTMSENDFYSKQGNMFLLVRLMGY